MPAILTIHVLRLPLYFVQPANREQSMFRQLTFVCIQIEEAAASVTHAANSVMP
ncbi:hypothetical protein HALA3H3_250024 [Halomonas sp. A3H3]|nr:hypothetical protein HALA3H3_250024 [Halomonas sp. A3H3]